MRTPPGSRPVVTAVAAVIVVAVLSAIPLQLAAAAGAQPDREGPPSSSSQRAQSSAAPATPEEDGDVTPGTGFVELIEGSRVVEVADDEQLAEAISDAEPGDVITLAPGTYAPVEIRGEGTEDAPITLIGPADAVFTGSGKDYTVAVEDASHWQLVGFTVTGGGKGIMVDDGQFLVLDSLTVGETGDEAVHFRSSSSDNVIQRSLIRNTGNAQPQYGEGVYVGSAKSNWKRYGPGGGPDLSMRNRVLGNTFENITAENIDIKEETAGTIVARNAFDGSAISGKNYADSVVDVKGYDAVVVDNVTTGQSDELGNIIETHVITEPETSGCGNTIEGNTVEGFEPTGAMVAVDKKCG
ncbi:MAG: hypothetical protein H7Y15_12575 [Pseudonocardia sp.]|nr:hypothetical protein [Pseudonocardia sp.]